MSGSIFSTTVDQEAINKVCREVIDVFMTSGLNCREIDMAMKQLSKTFPAAIEETLNIIKDLGEGA